MDCIHGRCLRVLCGFQVGLVPYFPFFRNSWLMKIFPPIFRKFWPTMKKRVPPDQNMASLNKDKIRLENARVWKLQQLTTGLMKSWPPHSASQSTPLCNIKLASEVDSTFCIFIDKNVDRYIILECKVSTYKCISTVDLILILILKKEKWKLENLIYEIRYLGKNSVSLDIRSLSRMEQCNNLVIMKNEAISWWFSQTIFCQIEPERRISKELNQI